MTQRQRDLFDKAPPAWELDDVEDQPVATVVFPQPPFGPFDYLVPDRLRAEVEPGRRLHLPMGAGNRAVVGYCVGVQPQSSSGRVLKPVAAVLDSEPLLGASMLRLTQWIAQYYLCPWGQVLEAVVPAGVRTGAGTRDVTVLNVSADVAGRLSQLKLPDKQAKALEYLVASSQPMTSQQLAAAVRITTAPITALIRKGLVRAETRRQRPLPTVEIPPARQPPWPLSPAQQAALDAILDALQTGSHKTVVVHGVTGSGKTEVYIRAIDEVVRSGRQAIVLVPEISLTPQTRHRFRSRFDSVAVLHSHLSDVERHGHWQRIARCEIQVVVGARSAVFAPTPRLGLIVLDEEHDASFKQDTAPRYHARDVALRRAEMEKVPLVLGSATPSLETFCRAAEGDFLLVDMPQRVQNRPLPQVTTIDLRLERADRHHRGALSRPLCQAMTETLKEGGQVILLLNRRGFSTHIQCPACGDVVRCPHCDIALTHHRTGDKAVCHYCDYQTGAQWCVRNVPLRGSVTADSARSGWNSRCARGFPASSACGWIRTPCGSQAVTSGPWPNSARDKRGSCWVRR